MTYKIIETLHYEGKEYITKEEVFPSESEALNEYIARVAYNSKTYEKSESWEENSLKRGLTHWFYMGVFTLQIDYIPTPRKRTIKKAE